MFATVWQKFVTGLNRLGPDEEVGRLGDFTTTPRVCWISLLAVVVGALSALVALILLNLINLFTNIFFFQRLSLEQASPAGNQLGVLEIAVPIIGALIVGLIARYGSERIRGHGIPEAIEAILVNGSKVEPKVALLKPFSAAISIGSGGPFGAEGPIIMTGGAFGSMVAQFIHLSSTERKTLLVAGAAGGMSAIFASPLAAVLLAVELLLFEWKPRSLIPVALASVTAAVIRHYLLGAGPLFPVPAHVAFIGLDGFLGCVLVGLLAGLLSTLLTMAVYASEDAFSMLPIHWMWWPAIGGLVIGLGGLIVPQTLGVGYETIGELLQGHVSLQLIVGILVVKALIWSISLGSGTSGGVLAPLLMIGGALGGVVSLFLPNEGAGFWVLISMGAVLGGSMRVPFTAVVFVMELTHDFNALLPLLVATVVAHGFTVLVMHRSILTEKISCRGFHLSREYAIDPLEILFVREVMRTDVVALPDQATQRDLDRLLHSNEAQRNQRLYPIIGKQEQLVGVATRRDLQRLLQDGENGRKDYALAEYVNAKPVVAYPDENLRIVAYRMAETGFTRLPIVELGNQQKLVGIVALSDLLKARSRNLTEERHRERSLRLRLLFPARTKVVS